VVLANQWLTEAQRESPVNHRGRLTRLIGKRLIKIQPRSETLRKLITNAIGCGGRSTVIQPAQTLTE